MSRLGRLTEDEKARYAALTFRMCKEDHWDVSACDCPSDCEHVQETEAEVQATVKKIRGESEMTKKSAKWVIVPEIPGPPPPLVFIDKNRNRRAVMYDRGFVRVTATDPSPGRYPVRSSYGDDIIVQTDDLRGLIASLESILVLAEEHFGEDWGK